MSTSPFHGHLWRATTWMKRGNFTLGTFDFSDEILSDRDG
jgi:hypothetical protein